MVVDHNRMKVRDEFWYLGRKNLIVEKCADLFRSTQGSCSSPMKAHYRELLEFRLDVISMIPADYIGYVLHSKWFVAIRILRFERKGRLGMISNTNFQ